MHQNFALISFIGCLLFVTGTDLPANAIQVTSQNNQYPFLSMSNCNGRFSGQPKVIYMCKTTEQVVNALQDALNSHTRVTIQSGGHCYENWIWNNTDGIIINLSPMNQIYQDDKMGNMYCIEGGTVLYNVYFTLYRTFGVFLPGGTCGAVGISGHTLGGGYGDYSRGYGLIIDYLSAIEVVTVDEHEQIHVTITYRGEDLFWAHTGGGGGNFGIVTRFWFGPTLPQPPVTVYTSSFSIPYTSINQTQYFNLLTNYGNWFYTHRNSNPKYNYMYSSLRMYRITRGTAFGGRVYVFGNDTSLINEYFTYLNQSVGVIPNPTITTTTWWQQMGDNIGKMGYTPEREKSKSAYWYQPFTLYQLQTFWTWLTDQQTIVPIENVESPIFILDSRGGKITERENTDTAVYQRNAIMIIQFIQDWYPPQNDDVNINWIRSFYTALFQETGGEPNDNGIVGGCYVNYCDNDLKNWSSLYYGGNYVRLAEIKKQWDPLNKFTHEQGIGS